MRPISRICSALLLAAAIHLDWHLSRAHDHGRLSGNWPLHWLIALPIFAGLALRLSREPAAVRWRDSVWVILGGFLVGQVLEPLFEVLTDGVGWDWMLHGPRWIACAEFLAAGCLTHLLVMAWRAPAIEASADGG
ncbi:MAG TPA: hypothetical protein VL241_00870 [Gemmatimonadales bacterium]|nr:hypothetical protein [Gemmatimonadales bacterium]